MLLPLQDGYTVGTQGAFGGQEAGTTVRGLKFQRYGQDTVKLNCCQSPYSSTQDSQSMMGAPRCSNHAPWL